MADIAVLLSTLELDNFEHRPFIPFSQLEVLFTREKIIELLQQHKLEFHILNEIVHRILGGGLRTFAVLAAIQDIGNVARFIKADQFSDISLDSKLPLNEADIPRYFADPDKGKLFLRRQWTFFAPVFSENQSRRDLDDRTILPFLHKNFIGQGGFAKIYKIDLICKELARPDTSGTLAKDFDREASILSALRCLQHPNIIQLIAAFSKGPVYSFLFPVADGDLKSLLNTPYRLPGFQTETEILGSLWGLSSALEAVHDYFFPQLDIRQIGCHYDIKPSNILYINGRLLLSDFGLSRLRRHEDGSQTTFKAGEGSYIAPECESVAEGFTPGKIGRASDVWSFGCVLADILVYFSVEPANGPAAVQNFYESRRSKVGSFVFYPFYQTDRCHPTVRMFLDHCKADTTLSQALRSLAKVVEDTLQFKPAQRPSAADITRLLFHLTQQIRVATITSAFGRGFESADLELELQMERLKIWSDVVGLDTDLRGVTKSTWSWFAANHSITEYESLQLLLTQIGTEVGTIAAELQKAGPCLPAFRLSYRLQKLLDELWDSQLPAVRRYLYSQLEEIMLSKASYAQSRAAIDLVRGSLSDSRDGDSCLSSTERLYRRFVHLTTMRSIASAMTHQGRETQDLRLDTDCIKGPRYDLGPHTVATFEPTGKLVLVEYIIYGEWSSRADELVERVNAIASLRSMDVSKSIFPILQCHGHYHDHMQSEVGIVYELPTEAQNTVPISFNTALQKTKTRVLQPSLTQRYKLASTLVAHVLNFHRGGWLHKSISALNIICFPEAFPSIAASLAAPYFIGFNRSRLNNSRSYSSLSWAEKEYQHPAYLRNSQAHTDGTTNSVLRFRQEFDYYSVGMVLMEIAFWKPLSFIIEKFTGPPEEILTKLLEKVVPLVTTYMGDVYEAAVRYCLTAYKEGQHSPEIVRDGFNKNVVLSISRCLV
ncbi:hypothetical protein MMC27_005898 [Xylographa pallens]|nr:hypothetical protein [Xylographa pallens]